MISDNKAFTAVIVNCYVKLLGLIHTGRVCVYLRRVFYARIYTRKKRYIVTIHTGGVVRQWTHGCYGDLSLNC